MLADLNEAIERVEVQVVLRRHLTLTMPYVPRALNTGSKRR
jgi:hypothetical protein